MEWAKKKLTIKNVYPELQRIYEAFINASDGAILKSDYMNSVSLRLLDLVGSVCPEYVAFAEHLTNRYDEIVDLDLKRNQTFKRCAEDIRDIIERKFAINQLHARFTKTEKKYMAAKKAWINAKGKPEELTAKAKAAELLEQAKSQNRELIDQYERFGLFMKRRLAHCFTLLANTMRETYCSEKGAYELAVQELNDDMHELNVRHNPDRLDV